MVAGVRGVHPGLEAVFDELEGCKQTTGTCAYNNDFGCLADIPQGVQHHRFRIGLLIDVRSDLQPEDRLSPTGIDTALEHPQFAELFRCQPQIISCPAAQSRRLTHFGRQQHQFEGMYHCFCCCVLGFLPSCQRLLYQLGLIAFAESKLEKSLAVAYICSRQLFQGSLSGQQLLQLLAVALLINF